MVLDHKEIATLEKRISLLKRYLIDLVKDREFTDPVVLAVSQHLDRLLNRYNRHKSNE